MQRFAKVLAIGAALTGLGLVVAGTALADSAGPSTGPRSRRRYPSTGRSTTRWTISMHTSRAAAHSHGFVALDDDWDDDDRGND